MQNALKFSNTSSQIRIIVSHRDLELGREDSNDGRLYSDKADKEELEGEIEGPGFLITLIKNTGEGIPKEKIQNLFSMFNRTVSSF